MAALQIVEKLILIQILKLGCKIIDNCLWFN